MNQQWKRLRPQRWWAVTWRNGQTFAICRTRWEARARRRGTLSPENTRIAQCLLVEEQKYRVPK